MAWVAFLDSWTPWPAGSSELLETLQAAELLDSFPLGHGPDSAESADFLDRVADFLDPLDSLDSLADFLDFLVSSGHAPLLLASSLAPGHAPLLSGDNARFRPEPGRLPFFLPTLRGIWARESLQGMWFDEVS